jgi:hypothetical protein
MDLQSLLWKHKQICLKLRTQNNGMPDTLPDAEVLQPDFGQGKGSLEWYVRLGHGRKYCWVMESVLAICEL